MPVMYRVTNPGFNLFDHDDEALSLGIARGEFNIGGLQNNLQRRFPRARAAAKCLDCSSAVVSAASPQTVTIPSQAILTGTVTGDGLPDNTLTITWTMQSGPAPMFFDNPNEGATAATFTTGGTCASQHWLGQQRLGMRTGEGVVPSKMYAQNEVT